MTTPTLFDPNPAQEQLDQFFTPEWAASRLYDRFFSDLNSSDLLVEPSCGVGRFLKAVPSYVPAIGVEIDPVVAAEAVANTGREIIVGDFTTVELPKGVTAMIGNPPFQVALINKFIARGRSILPTEGRIGFLLPAYALQTAATIEPWRTDFSLQVEMVPRKLFPGLSKPLVFVVFRKNKSREIVGMCLYDECVAFDRMGDLAKDVLTNGRPRKGVWRALIETVIEQLGGEADLQSIYRAVEAKRPTANAWWKEQIRKVLHISFMQTDDGRWMIPAPCAA